MDGFRVMAEKMISFPGGAHWQGPVVNKEITDIPYVEVAVGSKKKKLLETEAINLSNWVAIVKTGKSGGGIPL